MESRSLLAKRLKMDPERLQVAMTRPMKSFERVSHVLLRDWKTEMPKQIRREI
jgi:hypothetical protein